MDWDFGNGVLTISGSGEMYDFTKIYDSETGKVTIEHPNPWEDFSREIKEINVKDGVTSVGFAAFADFKNLNRVTLGNSVKIIGCDAFANDSRLTEFTAGSSLEEIYADAFYGVSLKELILPSTIKAIASFALIKMPKLEKIKMTDNTGVY